MKKNPIIHYMEVTDLCRQDLYDIGIGKSTVSRIINGKPDVIITRILKKLCQLFNVREVTLLEQYQAWKGIKFTGLRDHAITWKKNESVCQKCGKQGHVVCSVFWEDELCRKCYRVRYLEKYRRGELERVYF